MCSVLPHERIRAGAGVELPYCMSCQGVIQDFSTMFTNVKIILIDGLKY